MVKPLHMAKEFYVQAPIPRFENDLLLIHSPSQVCSLCHCGIHLSPDGLDWDCDVVIHDTGNGCNVSNIKIKSQNYPIQIYLNKKTWVTSYFVFYISFIILFFNITEGIKNCYMCIVPIGGS